MTTFAATHPTEAALMAFYLVLCLKSVVIRDWPHALYWGGALILMCGVLMGMVVKHE